MTMTAQLPLMVSINGLGTDSPGLPGFYALPAGSVIATPEVNREEDRLVSGYGVRLTPRSLLMAVNVRIDVPDDHPLPRILGEAWAALAVGSGVSISETHTTRGSRTQYVNAEILSNTLRVTRQASLTEAYYSGSIEARVLIDQGG